MYQKAHRLSNKKLIIDSAANSNIADMGEQGDIAICDATSADQTVLMPLATNTYGQEVIVSMTNATNDTLVKDSTGVTTLFTLSAIAKTTFLNVAGTWTKL